MREAKDEKENLTKRKININAIKMLWLLQAANI